MATKADSGWSNIEKIGLVVLALGIAFLAYSAYNFVIPSIPTITTSHAFNASGYAGSGNYVSRGTGGGAANYSRYESDAGAAGFSPTAFEDVGTPFILRIGDMLSGALLAVLGFVVFKYGGLKKALRAK